MNIKSFSICLGKLLLCSLVFVIGAFVGGAITAIAGLQQPVMPEGVDSSSAFLLLSLGSPLMALVLALIARGLAGKLLARALTISIFTWVTYTLNTAVESLAFTDTTVEGALTTTITFLFPSIFIGVAVAQLFPSDDNYESMIALVKRYFGRRTTTAWAWRIFVAALVFVPIYLFFGLLVAPITGHYFQENVYGLRQPDQYEMLFVLMIRSVLFLLACLPIFIMWRRSKWGLFMRLGLALFILVGFLYMLGAYYMPLMVRIPHSLEILADSFAYAGLLVLLLSHGNIQFDRKSKILAIT